ncbi:flagellar basal body-associated FliL family protein [Thalassobius sp. S69A]|uniref:flagellar basal body-associated FliL family protein n=1 Tax=unclassified Thalassovita TaxID=2619711 RepID=UPI000C0C7F4B|nr:flagellar basal body protein FliL [Paracoccaceae bacterium]MBT24853.1 flagellar basal body protein FliL [Paracoccaceae bacterium]
MTATEAPEEEITKKSSKLPMIIGVFLAVAGGGGGFFAAQSGMLPFGESSHAAEHEASATHDEKDGNGQPMDAASDVSFVPIDPLLISLGPRATAQHLRFKGQVETPSEYAKEVEMLMPRIVDVLNSYLRAVDESDLEKPTSLVRLRAQMLRRVQIVVGQDRVNDLLIMEFVLN